MADPQTYSIYTTGELISGFERETVLNTFSSVFSITPEKAEKFVDTKRLVKKDLVENEAKKYQTHLNKIGVASNVYSVSSDGGSSRLVDFGAPEPALSISPVDSSKGNDSLVSTNNTNSATSTNTKASLNKAAFSCPKCEEPQPKSEQCTSCGIFFQKYEQAKQQNDSVGAENSRGRGSNTFTKANHDDCEDINIATIGLTFAAAVVGAFLWKFIAFSFGYELGLVAWAIGGAVGAAAAMTGARGEMTGGLCAVLALLAIFGGKYMFASASLSELEVVFSGEGMGEYLDSMYDEANADKAAFAKINKDDASIKVFMIKHDYTDAEFAYSIDDTELQEFKEYTQPWLEEPQETAVSWDEFQEEIPDLSAAIEEISPTSMVFESLGPLDLLFAFLGLSTAFGLGRNGFSRG